MLKNTRAIAPFLGFALVALGSPPAHAGSSAQATLKVALEDAKDNMDHCFSHAYSEYKVAMKAIEKAVASSEISAGQAIKAAEAAASKFSADLDLHVVFVSQDFLAIANGLLAELDGKFPKGFKAGDCGSFDQLLESLEKALATFRGKGMKRLKKFEKKLKDAGGEIKISVSIQIFVVVPPVAAPGNPAPAPKPLKIRGASSANDPAVANDGTLTMRGTGAPGSTVKVTARGPNGEVLNKEVVVGNDCTWSVAFPAAPGDGPGNLAEGNWRMDASSGTETATKNHGV